MQTTTALQSTAGSWAEWALLFVRPGGPGFWLLADIVTALVLALALAMAAGIQQRWAPLFRAIRWLLIPTLALLLAAVSPQSMGLTGVDWENGLRLGLPLGAALLVLLVLVRLAVPSDSEAAPAPTVRGRDAGAVPFTLLYSAAQQLHWCFQRAAMFALVVALPSGPAAPSYWAMWAASLLAAPELLQLRSGWARLWSLIALAGSAILFLYTRNFWLGWLLHAGTLLLAGPMLLRTLPAARPAPGPR